MWSVDSPNFDVEETFTTCISRVKNKALKNRLISVTQNVVQESETYEAHATAGDMHLVMQSDDVAGSVTKEEMVAVYRGRMAGKTGPGRSIYTAIKLLPEHDRCPFCDHRDVTTLDHILPKTLFPALAVTPLNLVGACKDCNKAKLTAAPTCAEDSVLHPYFDDISDQTWLSASVVEQEVCAVLFNIKVRQEWSDELNSRLANQFKSLGLAHLYSQQAAREISGIRNNLIRVFESEEFGHKTVERELHHQWQSRQMDRRNSWQTALYKALSNNGWFCKGGFRLGVPV